jgi:hypothetical protein
MMVMKMGSAAGGRRLLKDGMPGLGGSTGRSTAVLAIGSTGRAVGHSGLLRRRRHVAAAAADAVKVDSRSGKARERESLCSAIVPKFDTDNDDDARCLSVVSPLADPMTFGRQLHNCRASFLVPVRLSSLFVFSAVVRAPASFFSSTPSRPQEVSSSTKGYVVYSYCMWENLGQLYKSQHCEGSEGVGRGGYLCKKFARALRQSKRRVHVRVAKSILDSSIRESSVGQRHSKFKRWFARGAFRRSSEGLGIFVSSEDQDLRFLPWRGVFILVVAALCWLSFFAASVFVVVTSQLSRSDSPLVAIPFVLFPLAK